jgi:hypothetical protein
MARIVSVSAVTGRPPTANTTYRKRAREKVNRDREAAEQSKLSLPETRGQKSAWFVHTNGNNTIRLARKQAVIKNAKIEPCPHRLSHAISTQPYGLL